MRRALPAAVGALLALAIPACHEPTRPSELTTCPRSFRLLPGYGCTGVEAVVLDVDGLPVWDPFVSVQVFLAEPARATRFGLSASDRIDDEARYSFLVVRQEPLAAGTLSDTVTVLLVARKVEPPGGPNPVGVPLPVIATDTVPVHLQLVPAGARIPLVTLQMRLEPVAPSP